MSTTLNIPVNVPQGFNVNLLVAQLTEYAKTLIVANTTTTASRKHYKHEALSGIFDSQATQEEFTPRVMHFKRGNPMYATDEEVDRLRHEYLTEKYK